MDQAEKDIELDFNSGQIFVKQYLIEDHFVFRVRFSDDRKPLVITKALDEKAMLYWTSVPEGRQREAEETGQVIAAYLKNID